MGVICHSGTVSGYDTWLLNWRMWVQSRMQRSHFRWRWKCQTSMYCAFSVHVKNIRRYKFLVSSTISCLITISWSWHIKSQHILMFGFQCTVETKMCTACHCKTPLKHCKARCNQTVLHGGHLAKQWTSGVVIAVAMIGCSHNVGRKIRLWRSGMWSLCK